MKGTDLETMLAVGVSLTVIVGGLAGAWRKWAGPFIRKIGYFLDDWNGEPARPGFDGRPSVPVRLEAIEREQRRVSHEVQTNSGSSLKDAVKRLESARAADREALDTLAALFGSFVGKEQTARIEGHKAQTELFRTMQEINGEEGHQ